MCAPRTLFNKGPQTCLMTSGITSTPAVIIVKWRQRKSALIVMKVTNKKKNIYIYIYTHTHTHTHIYIYIGYKHSVVLLHVAHHPNDAQKRIKCRCLSKERKNQAAIPPASVYICMEAEGIKCFTFFFFVFFFPPLV